MGMSVVGSSEHKTPGFSWPVNPENAHWHSRRLDQDASWSWCQHSQWSSPGQSPEPSGGHTNHWEDLVSLLSYLRRGRNQFHVSHTITFLKNFFWRSNWSHWMIHESGSNPSSKWKGVPTIDIFIHYTQNCLPYSKPKHFSFGTGAPLAKPTGQFWQLPLITWKTVYVFENCMFLPYCLVKMSRKWKTGCTDTSDF